MQPSENLVFSLEISYTSFEVPVETSPRIVQYFENHHFYCVLDEGAAATKIVNVVLHEFSNWQIENSVISIVLRPIRASRRFDDSFGRHIWAISGVLKITRFGNRPKGDLRKHVYFVINRTIQL